MRGEGKYFNPKLWNYYAGVLSTFLWFSVAAKNHRVNVIISWILKRKECVRIWSWPIGR